MAENIDIADQAIPDNFEAFFEDLRGEDTRILPDIVIRDLIRTVKDSETPDEERIEARGRMYNSTLRLIPYAIRRWGLKFIPPEELIGEAFQTLDSCIDTFDLDRVSTKDKGPAKFTTYVFQALKRNMGNPLTYEYPQSPIRVPPSGRSYAGIMSKAWEVFVQENQREPDDEEWYLETLKFLDESGLKQSENRKTTRKETFDSLNTHAIEKPYLPIGRFIATGRVDPDTLEPELEDIGYKLSGEEDTFNDANYHNLIETVKKALSNLSPREQKVLELKFGLDETGEHTQNEIAKELGITRERVSQIEHEAYYKLRDDFRTREVLRGLLKD